MKPRNDFERELQGYIDSGKITEPTAKQMEQGVKIMEQHKEYKMYIFNTTQTINGMELTKCYKAHRCDKGGKMTMFLLCLIKAKRDNYVAWAGRGTYLGYVDSFSHNGALSIKNKQWWYEDYITGNDVLQSTGKADTYAVAHHYNHNGYLFHDSHIETIAKSHDPYDYQLFQEVVTNLEKPLPKHIWQAYKIAKRHGYNFQGDMFRWICYINLLRAMKKDYRNPTIICPNNLVQAHYRLIDERDGRKMAKRRRQEELAEYERLQEAIKNYEESYIEQHRRWLAMVIVGDGITITPLHDITEFYNEGKNMRHCVFSAGYYKQANTLILSAKDSDGNRIATIEYDTKNGVIVQCRAACNQQPKRYDEICALVMDGIKGKKVRCAA